VGHRGRGLDVLLEAALGLAWGERPVLRLVA